MVRGVNLGSWLNIEHFMIGLPGCDWQLRAHARQIWGEEKARAFFDAYLDHFITRHDIENIAAAGFTALRLPVDYRLLESDLAPGVYDGPAWSRIADCLAWCESSNLALMLDLHGTPGGQNCTYPSGNFTGYSSLWFDRASQDRTAALWSELVRRFKDAKALWSYNLFNEPMINNPGPLSMDEQCLEMNRFIERLILLIRQQDREHWITIEPPVRSSGGVQQLDPAVFNDERTVLSYHHYPLASHETGANYEREQSNLWTPAALNEFIRAHTSSEHAYADRIARPVVLGEFGWSKHWHPERGRAMVEAQLRRIETNGWGWLLWAYKDLDTLGLYNPAPETGWARWTRNPGRKELAARLKSGYASWFNSQVIPFLHKHERNYRVFDAAYNDALRGIDRMLLDHDLRELASRSTVELVDFAKDFSLERCCRREDLFGLLTPWLQHR
jgi:aryl-phospho-beta-D-glucosidase BglC (GH1 family)